MQDLKVTLVQANQVWENISANLEHYTKLLEPVASDLIVLPEMFQTSFTMNHSLAEPMESSRSISWLKQLAATKNSAVYASLMIEEKGKYFNRGVFVEPNGTMHIYDKRKTFGLAKEDLYIASGTQKTIVQYRGWNIQLQICYDLRFPEISRNLISANQEAAFDVLIYVANWPQKRSAHWNALLQARAIENQCFVIGVNRVGTDGMGFTYSGDSQIVNALGERLLLPVGEEFVKTIVINKKKLTEIRELLPFLKDA